MPRSTCPTHDELSGYARGTLPPQLADNVSTHLAACPACEETLDTLGDLSDPLLRQLRPGSKSEPYVGEPGCARALESVGRKLPAGSPAQPAASSVPPPVLIMNRATFVDTLASLGLLSSDETTVIEKQLPTYDPADAQPLVRALVTLGKLTKFQAAALYQGRGKTLVYGDYLVLDRIGAGGMGQVFKARHRRMDRIVALKVMSQASMKNADSVKRFEREVKAAAKLTHPNIVHAYDAGVQDGVHYLVMELVDGADLSSLLKKHGKLGLKQGCAFIAQAARGFAAAHAKGVIHRDIKPGNLLVDRDGNVKVLDMGLARFDDGGVGGVMAEGELTAVGAVMGTVDYMAPEQALNTRHADAKSDVYGLGCTLYRVVTGESVFAGETLVEKVLAHRDQPIPSLRRVRPDAPAALDQLLTRMLAKKPQDRPTMQEVADRLAALDFAAAGNSGIGLSGALPMPSNTEPSGIGLAPAPVFPGASAPAIAPPRPRTLAAAPPRKRSNLPLLAIAGGGALLICLGVWVYIKDKDGNTIAAVQVPEQGSVSIVPGEASPTGPEAPAKITPKSTPTSTVPTVVPQGPVDLLSLIDVSKHVVHGIWNRTNGKLLGGGVPDSRVQVPFTPPEEYDVVLSGRKITDAKAGIQIGLVAKNRQFFIQIGPDFISPSVNGFIQNDHRRMGLELPLEQPFRITCAVRNSGVTVDVNGRPMFDFHEDYNLLGLAPHTAMPAKDQLLLGGWEDPRGPMAKSSEPNWEISSLVLTPPGAATSSAPANVPPTAAPVEQLPDQITILSSAPFQYRAFDELLLGAPVPDYLRGKTPYVFVQRRGQANIANGQVAFRPTVSGPLYMSGAWGNDGSIDAELRQHIMDDAALRASGWTPVGKLFLRTLIEPQLPKPDDQEHTIYVRQCVAGENLVIRTRKYGPPMFFVNDPSVPAATNSVASVTSSAPAGPMPQTIRFTLGRDVTMNVKLIPAGTFTMGSPAGEVGRESGEQQRPVTISRPFYICETEVTNAQWLAAHDSSVSRAVTPDADVARNNVSWEAAVAFAEKMNQSQYGRSYKFRLPTEAEWEYACRAGTGTTWHFGNDPAQLVEYGWHKVNTGREVHPVAKLKPNPFGLYDMYGNVYEWCHDFHAVDLQPPAPQTDPQGPTTGKLHVLRGGCFQTIPNNTRSATRFGGEGTWPAYGLRLVCERTAGPFPPPGAVAATPTSAGPPPAVAAPPAVTDPASERATALAVLAKKGRIKVRVGGQVVQEYIDQPAALPPAPFELVEVSFYNIAAAGDQDLALLRNATAIETLVLNSTQVSDQGLAALQNLKQLRMLKLPGTQVRGPGLVHLASLPQLRELIFADQSLNNSVSQTVGMLRNLEHLEMVRSQVSDVSFVRSLPNLTNLNFGGSRVHALVGFETLGNLKFLNLWKTDIADDDLAAVQNLTTLETLNLSVTNLTDACIPFLEKLAKLKTLNLDETYITDAGAARLQAKLPQCKLTFKTKPGSPPPPSRAMPPVVAAVPSTIPSPGAFVGTPPPAAIRGPAPDAAARKAALTLIKDVFKDDFAAAKTTDQKSALAAKLIDQAKQTLDDSASRYVLLDEARLLAVEITSASVLREAVTAIVENYEVEEATTFVDAWNALLKRPRVEAPTVQLLYTEANGQFDQAVTEARFDDAKRFGDFASTIARRATNPTVAVRTTTQRNAALAARQKEWPTIVAAAEKLTATPDDAAANLTIARYQALVADDRSGAFSQYAKCGQETLAKLGAASAAGAADSAAQLALGDQWWDAAQAVKAAERAELLAGADYWYGVALPALGGLSKSRIEKRVADIAPSLPTPIIPATTLPAAISALGGSSDSTNGAMPIRGGLGDPPTTIKALGSPSSASPPPAPSNASAAVAGAVTPRTIAERILGIRGTVVVVEPAGGERQIKSVVELPQGDFDIVSVTSNYSEGMRDADMQAFASLRKLRRLNIQNSEITGSGFTYFQGHPALENMLVNRCPLTDASLAHLVAIPKLTELDVAFSPVSDAGLLHLQRIPQLERINLIKTNVTDVGMRTLAGLTRLRMIYLDSTSVGDAGLELISGLQDLEVVSLRATRVTDRSVQSISRMKSLRQMWLRDSPISDAAVQALQQQKPGATIKKSG